MASRFQASFTPAQGYMLWALGGGMAFRFVDPLFNSLHPWSIGVVYTQQWWAYDAPDPTVDPTTARTQLDSIVSVTLSVPFDDMPQMLERLLGAWLVHRNSADESFFEFCQRHEIDDLRALGHRAPIRAVAA